MAPATGTGVVLEPPLVPLPSSANRLVDPYAQTTWFKVKNRRTQSECRWELFRPQAECLCPKRPGHSHCRSG